MKNINKYSSKILSTIAILLFSTSIIFAQNDTTKVEIGKKKIIVVGGETIKNQAITNLEKGKETFIKEIEKAEKELETLNDENQALLKQLSETTTEEEAEEIKRKIKINEDLIAANEQKTQAFKNGIADIDEGIAEIKKELKSINFEGDSIANIHIKTKKELDKKFNAHWAGFEMGIVNYLNNSMALAKDYQTDFMRLRPEKSFTYSFNIFEKNIPITKKSFGLVTGAGLQWNSLFLAQNVDLVENNLGEISALYIDPAMKNYEKNRLNMAYLTVPLIAELQIPAGNEKLYISAGITGSMRLWSKQKQKYFVDDIKNKNKITDDFQLSPFRYGATFRIGYGDIGLFADYELVSLFRKEKGPELYPITVGIRIINF